MATTGQATRYQVLRPLGSGGMAQVMLAEDTVLGRRVALKRLRVTGDADGIKRLRREALIGASLNHPNLIPVYDVWEEADGALCIVMEYVAGNTLRDLIRDGGAVPAAKAIPILTGVAAGLDAVHKRGIVHRDVKPANILLGVDGQIKLADLGIAAVDDYTKITTADKVVGSFSYMAPEQLEGGRPQPAIDIYALAAVAFETLCGKKARPEPNPVALAHAIATCPPPDLRDCVPEAPVAAAAVLKRGMSADPDERPRTAGELIVRLEAAFNERQTAVTVPAATLGAAGAGAAASGAAAVAAPPARLTGERLAGRPSPGSVRYRSHREAPSRMVALAALAALLVAVAAVALLSSGGGKQSSSSTGHGTRAARHRGSTHHLAAAASGGSTSTPAASGSSGSSTTASAPAAAGGTTSGTSAGSGSPAGAVESFYEAAARHDYATAWALADPNLRNQLNGYDSFRSQMSAVRSITFHRAQTVSGADSSPATVALSTTSVQNAGTQNCSGTAQTVRGSTGTWLVDHLTISCSPA
jgi:hypothetical protein